MANDLQLPSLSPDIRLFGKVNEAMLTEFFRQQAQAQPDKPIVMELSTSGGDADIGRRIAQEVRMWRAGGRDAFFLGKTYVYSAGITVMSSFPRTHRFLTADCELLVHERKIKKELHLVGALRGCLAMVNDVLAEIEPGQRLEREGFEALVQGTSLSVEDVLAKVCHKDWYLTARQALAIELVEGEAVLVGRDGKLFAGVLRAQRVPQGDVEQALREADCDLADMKCAFLEADGKISILKDSGGGT